MRKPIFWIIVIYGLSFVAPATDAGIFGDFFYGWECAWLILKIPFSLSEEPMDGLWLIQILLSVFLNIPTLAIPFLLIAQVKNIYPSFRWMLAITLLTYTSVLYWPVTAYFEDGNLNDLMIGYWMWHLSIGIILMHHLTRSDKHVPVTKQ